MSTVPSPRLRKESRVWARARRCAALFGLELAPLGALVGLGGDHLQDLVAESAQGLGCEVGGQLDQGGLGLGQPVRANLGVQGVEGADDDPGLGGVDPAVGQPGGDQAPAFVEVLGEPLGGVVGGVVGAGVGGEPGAGVAGAVGCGDVPGPGGRSQLQGLESAEQGRGGLQGVALGLQGEVGGVGVGDLLQRGLDRLQGPGDRVLVVDRVAGHGASLDHLRLKAKRVSIFHREGCSGRTEPPSPRRRPVRGAARPPAGGDAGHAAGALRARWLLKRACGRVRSPEALDTAVPQGRLKCPSEPK
jgi:hypothetical protein